MISETGRKVIFVNMVFTTRILGIEQQESDELLGLLYRHMNRPEFPARRVMDRISVVGDVPVGAPA